MVKCVSSFYKISNRQTIHLILLVIIIFLHFGCSSTKFLNEGENVLRKVQISADNKNVKASSYRMYVRQESNSRWFNLVKVPLGIYCLSGSDSTSRVNRFIQRIGEAPVVYSQDMTDFSANALKMALQGKGYLNSWVEVDTLQKGRYIDLHYRLHPGQLKYVHDFSFHFDNENIEDIVLKDTVNSLLYRGMPLDMSILSSEQKRIIQYLRNQGYYKINKDYITFIADTTNTREGIHLMMYFSRPMGVDSLSDYKKFLIHNVHVFEDIRYKSEETLQDEYHGLNFHYGKSLKLRKKTYNTRVHLRPDSLYRDDLIQATYGSLNSLSALDYSTVQFRELSTDEPLLDCYVYTRPGKRHNISMELEGTNTSGDLGAAVVLGYNNRNIFKGSEVFSLKARGAYEAITGLEGYHNQNYIELSLEGRIKFPTIIFPGIKQNVLRKLKATSEVSVMYDSQNRPEFHRRVLMGDWGYRWSHHDFPNLVHRFDLLSLNYVFMPWISETFRNEYLEGDDPHYAILRYSYENLLIMNMGYSLVYNSLKNTSALGLYQTNGYQIRFAVETAGNLLHAISKWSHASKNSDGQYQCFNIAYSQYVKVDFDFIKSFVINDRNSIAFHAALGIAIPYGNSDIIPYEKRYFSGGANSVRGWSVRELGPGSYVGRNGKIDFINQTGNLKLDLSLEYRTRLLGKLHGAFFVDAGNVWNTRNYIDQPGGQFHLDSFYKQIAVAYGLGLRFNLDYFILRFDGGMKAINPSIPSGRGHYPILYPNFSRDFTFHFAVGMPF